MDAQFLSDVFLTLRGFTTLYHLPGDDEGRAGVLNRLEKEFLEAAHGTTVSV